MFVCIDVFVRPSVLHMWCTRCHPCTTASEHTPWCTALALTTTCVLLVCVVVCTSTHSFFFHSHTPRGGNGLWCRVAQKSALRERMNTHTRPLPFSFLFSLNPFQWRIWRHSLSLTSTFHSLVHSLSKPCACK